MADKINAIVKHRYKTAATLTAENPILLAGEIGIESDTLKLKVGDEVTTWNLLPYVTTLSVAGDTSVGQLKYNGITNLEGTLYGGISDPVGTERLNYDGYLYATRVYNAVYNDLVDCFETYEGEDIVYNKVYVLDDNGMAVISNKRADARFIGISSNTGAFVMHEMLLRQGKGIPIGIAGKVWVEYGGFLDIGDEVVSYTNGKVVKATKVEKIENRDSIVGKVLKVENDLAYLKVV